MKKIMATLIKIFLAAEDPQFAEFDFEDFSTNPIQHSLGRVRLAKDSGDICVLNGGGYSNAVQAKVIYKLRQHWSAKELPNESSFAA